MKTEHDEIDLVNPTTGTIEEQTTRTKPGGQLPVPQSGTTTPYPQFFPISGLYTSTIKTPTFPLPIPVPRLTRGTVTGGRPTITGDGGTTTTEGTTTTQTTTTTDGTNDTIGYSGFFQRNELRLDVDGPLALKIASGRMQNHAGTPVDWIANIQETANNQWKGSIFYKHGNVGLFPYTEVIITATGPIFFGRTLHVTFTTGTPGLQVQQVYTYAGPGYHLVNFEFDYEAGVTPVTEINTYAHPNHPANIPNENLTIQTVFQRAGFNVATSAGGGTVPLTVTGGDGKWSDAELQDAITTYWSLNANKAQWAAWTFFAGLSEQGSGLGGIMFDDIGTYQRQGCVVFTKSFISTPPAGDPNPTEWVKRMTFWTAVHEMGHTFNLAHSWQKSLAVPWVPLTDEPEARSFMNYPYRVAGGQTAFFQNFQYRFSESELLFLRHAPAQFVEQGNATWFNEHGFEQSRVSPEPALTLSVRVNRTQPVFEFMEPIVIELKLTNVSLQPEIVDEQLLQMGDQFMVIIRKDGKDARQFKPFARYCRKPSGKVLVPRESMYESLFISAGLNGWDIAEPGYYTVQIALQRGEEDIISNPLRIRIAPPRTHEEEFIGQDFFSQEVGRILTFDGSQVYTKGNDILQEVTAKLSDRRVAIHAALALGIPATKNYKTLGRTGGNGRLQFNTAGPDPTFAQQRIEQSLLTKKETAVETLGHVDFKYYSDLFTEYLLSMGLTKDALTVQDNLYTTFEKREVGGRKILPGVLEEINKNRRDLTLTSGLKKTHLPKN